MSKQKPRKNKHANTRTAWPIAVPVFMVVSARIVGGLYPQSALWGVNFHGFLDDPTIMLVSAIAVLALIPRVSDALYGVLDRVAELVFPGEARRSMLVHVAIAIAFGLLVRAFVVPFSFLGDGVHVARALFRYNTGAGLAYGTLWLEPMSTIVYNTLITTFVSTVSGTRGVDITAYTSVFIHVSQVLGIVYVFAILRNSAGITDKAMHRLALTAGLVGCAGILFYFGYVEFYAFLYLFGTMYLLAAVREVRRPGFPMWSTILLAASIAFHLSAIVFLPVHALVIWLWRRGHSAGNTGGGSLPVRTWACVVAGILVLALAAYVVMNVSGANPYFISMTATEGRLSLVHPQHLVDAFNNLFLQSPVGVALLIVILVMRRRMPSDDPRFLVAATSSVFWMALCVSHSAIARDWDVYALLGVSVLLTGYFFIEHLKDDSGRRYHLVQMTVQSLALVVPWIALNTAFEPSLRRYMSITETYAAMLPPEVSLGHFETLRSAFVTAGNTEGEIHTIQRSLQLTHDPYEFYKATRAFENARSMTPAMRSAGEDILKRIIALPDSIRSKAAGQDEHSRSVTLNDVHYHLARAIVRLVPEGQKAVLAESLLQPLYDRNIRRFDIAAYIGSRHFDVQRYDESLRWFEIALPDSGLTDAEGREALPSVYHCMGIIHAKRNDESRSLGCFRKAVSYPDVAAITWGDYGFACFTFGRYGEAILPFSRALQLDSNNANSLYCLGRIYLQDPQQNVTGRRLLRRYLAIDPDSPRAREARSLIEKPLEQLRETPF